MQLGPGSVWWQLLSPGHEPEAARAVPTRGVWVGWVSPNPTSGTGE